MRLRLITMTYDEIDFALQRIQCLLRRVHDRQMCVCECVVCDKQVADERCVD